MKAARKISILLLALVLGLSAVCNMAAFTPNITYAEEITYSNVLDDLKKDTSFSADNYPANATDYSLQVI